VQLFFIFPVTVSATFNKIGTADSSSEENDIRNLTFLDQYFIDIQERQFYISLRNKQRISYRKTILQ
jgi:hypothetical protein